ncbi:MAG TPA: HAD family hydrolase [candidate division Zixibacteria bacterium]|nr:HAD family hydrolase [candidate division Zixibacteria bacterium]
MIEIIAFDGDDTLWHNETHYRDTAVKFERLLAANYGLSGIDGEIYKTEIKNLPYFGYGVKSYTISMIETAVRLTEGRIEGRHVVEIANFGRGMLDLDVELLDGAERAVAKLAASYPLMLITKGDQFEQERKFKRSGLASYFTNIEIVSEKTAASYAALFSKYKINPTQLVMVGNSLRSDILPLVKLGARAVYIPYEIIWEHETILDEPLDQERYIQIESMSALVSTVEAIDSN